jgi:hypothetical protein
MAAKIVLMAVPLPSRVAEGLTEFELVKLWEAADQESLLARLGPELRVIVTGVPILADGIARPIDKAFMARFPRLELITPYSKGEPVIFSAQVIG